MTGQWDWPLPSPPAGLIPSRDSLEPLAVAPSDWTTITHDDECD